MNKQSNIYTVVYIVILVAVVGTALACTALALRDRQQANADADKMGQILRSVGIEAPAGEVIADFDKYITGQLIVSSDGTSHEGDAFAVDVAKQIKLPASERELPVFVCTLPEAGNKYILPAYGAGLWGPIWGYIALDADGSTIYGAYFSHQGETPGLGAEIAKPAFSDEFKGKHLFKDGRFMPVAVVKAGQRPAGDEDYVDGISGGTITSKGVGAMIDDCLTPYQTYLSTLQAK